MEQINAGPVVPLELKGEVSIAVAGELRQALAMAVSSGHGVSVALEGAVRLDVTAFQLLWAAARQVRAGGHSFTLANRPRAGVEDALAEAGLPLSLLEELS